MIFFIFQLSIGAGVPLQGQYSSRGFGDEGSGLVASSPEKPIQSASPQDQPVQNPNREGITEFSSSTRSETENRSSIQSERNQRDPALFPYFLSKLPAENQENASISEAGQKDRWRVLDDDPTTILPINTTWAEYAVDNDGNGLYDQLVINLGLLSQTTQDYDLYGILKDRNGHWLGTSYRDLNTFVGNNLSLTFAGQAINASGADGPYDVWITFIPWYYSPPYELDFTRMYTTALAYNPNDFESPAATIIGFADRGLDTDGDQLFNEIVVEVSIEVRTAGYYTAAVFLGSVGPFDLGYAMFKGQQEEYLAPGNRTIAVAVPTYAFYSGKLNGPYSVGFAYLWGPVQWQQFLHDAYMTSNYQYTGFDPPSVLFTGIFRDRGTDTTGTGKFDRLEITAQINVTIKRVYTVDLKLRPSVQGVSEMEGSTVGLWDKGIHNVTIPVDTRRFYSQRVNTSFEVWRIEIRDPADEIVDQAYAAYETWVYNYTEFETPIVQLIGAYSDRGVDLDADGKYDSLIVDVGVNVTQRGFFTIDLLLKPALSPNSLQEFWGSVASIWTPGVQNISVAVDMGLMYSLQLLNTSFLMKEISIRDLRDETVDQSFSAFITQNYSWTAFNTPAVYCTGSYSVQGVDMDIDGTFDKLAIAAHINIRQEGEYYLEIYLRTTTSNPEGDYYDLWGDTSGYWASGVQDVTVTIDASQVHAWRLITAFQIEEIRIRDTRDWNTIMWVPAPYTTRVFAYTEFDHPGALLTGNCWDQGFDMDGNGKFEWLLIMVEVNVSYGAVYSLSLNLRAPPSAISYWNFYWDSGRDYRAPGIQNFTIQAYLGLFPTQRIMGSFRVENIELQTIDWITIDRAASPYTTRAYNSTDFDPANAYLTGNYWDQGVERDDNGKFYQLQITAEVMVRQAAYYRLELGLKRTMPDLEAYNDYFWRETDGDWHVGVQNVTVTFDHVAILAGNIATSFGLEGQIRDSDWTIIDWVTVPNVTGVYSPTELEALPIRLTGNCWDQGIDTEGNGIFNYLRIIIEANVTWPGTYHFELSLSTAVTSPAWETHGMWESIEVYWSMGGQNLTFLIDTTSFYAWRLNGSFLIEHLIIRNTNGDTISERSNYYVTQRYQYPEFELPGAFLTGQYWDQGADTDNDGTFDELVILIGVNVTKGSIFAGTYYHIELALRTTHDNRNYYESRSDNWAEGIQNISFAFSANRLALHRLNAAFAIETVRIWTAEGYNEIDQAILPFLSRVYNYTEFDPPGALLSYYFGDMGVDSDDDGDFDFLEIAIGVNVTETGSYELRLSFYSNTDYYSFDQYVRGNWQLGHRTISVLFDMSWIYAMRVNSVYTISEVTIHDENDYLLDEAYEPYSTRYYTYDEFDPPAVAIIGIVSDEGVDFDNDGLFDYLSFQIAVKVKEPTYFSLALEHFWGHQGIVYDVWGSDTLPVFYPAGLFNVTVHVDAGRIHEIAFSSPWTLISILIRDEFGSPVNYVEATYSTQAYETQEFETEWHWDERPPVLGGLHAALEPDEVRIELGDSIQFQIEIADNQRVATAHLVVNGEEDVLPFFDICQDCYPWKGNGFRSYIFLETGVFEFYAVVTDTQGQSSGGSNVLTVIVKAPEKEKIGPIPVRTGLAVGIFIAGLLMAAAVVVYIMRAPTRR
ncbi:MAG: hypothetical protein ACFFGZ_10000 [Candidatus Thorarchaeota archaeon]